jgi:hypothetical protein
VPRRQVQQPHVLPARALRLRLQQLVIGPPEAHCRKKVCLIAVLREGPRLFHQPVDDVPVGHPVSLLAPQPLQPFHLLAAIAQHHLFHTHLRFQPLPNQPRRHRVHVPLHPDRAASAYLHPQPLGHRQAACGQRPQHRLLLGQLPRTLPVPPRHHLGHERCVALSAAKVPAATHQQRLRQGLLETPMSLLAIAVLVPRGRVGRLPLQPVMRQQRPVTLRERLGMAVLVHRQTHPVGAVPPRHAAQSLQRALQPFAQARKALRQAQPHMLPVRVGQYEVIRQMGKRLTLDRHPQAAQMREIRGPQPARLMHLREEHFLGRTRGGTPVLDAPLHRPQQPLGITPRITFLQQRQQRPSLQARSAFQLRLQLRPYLGQGVRPAPPGVRHPPLAGQRPAPILPCCLAIHARLHRRLAQRCLLVQRTLQLLDLGVRHFGHRQTPPLARICRPILRGSAPQVFNLSVRKCGCRRWGVLVVAIQRPVAAAKGAGKG